MGHTLMMRAAPFVYFSLVHIIVENLPVLVHSTCCEVKKSHWQSSIKHSNQSLTRCHNITTKQLRIVYLFCSWQASKREQQNTQSSDCDLSTADPTTSFVFFQSLWFRTRFCFSLTKDCISHFFSSLRWTMTMASRRPIVLETMTTFGSCCVRLVGYPTRIAVTILSIPRLHVQSQSCK